MVTPIRLTTTTPLTRRTRGIASDTVEAFLQARNRIVHDLNVAPPPPTPTVADWVSVRDLVLTEVAEVVRGVRVKPDECGSEGVRVLRTREIGDEIGHDDPCFVDLDNMKPRPDVTAKGDIIISPASGRLRAVVDEGKSNAHVIEQHVLDGKVAGVLHLVVNPEP